MSTQDSSKRGFEYGVRHLVCDRTMSLLNFVSTLVPQERAKELIALGSIYVDELRRPDENFLLIPGSNIRAHLEPRRYPRPKNLEKRIVEETDGYLIVDKPAGLPVHALVDNIQENLISYLEEILDCTVLITHRLDVETSGLLLLALNPDVQADLNRRFAEQTVKRRYAAVVEKPIPIGSYVHYMEPSPKAPKVVVSDARENWLRCELRVVACDPVENADGIIENATIGRLKISNSSSAPLYQVKVELVTGRTQQIRAQLAALGFPILGDTKYGSQSSVIDATVDQPAIALRAFEIVFADD